MPTITQDDVLLLLALSFLCQSRTGRTLVRNLVLSRLSEPFPRCLRRDPEDPSHGSPCALCLHGPSALPEGVIQDCSCLGEQEETATRAVGLSPKDHAP